jgi:hypothetical protein
LDRINRIFRIQKCSIECEFSPKLQTHFFTKSAKSADELHISRSRRYFSNSSLHSSISRHYSELPPASGEVMLPVTGHNHMRTLIVALGLLSLSFAVTAGQTLTIYHTESYTGAKWRAPLLVKSQRTETMWSNFRVASKLRRPVIRPYVEYVSPWAEPQRKLDLIDTKFQPDSSVIVK